MKKAERHIQRAIELMDAVSLTKHNPSFGEKALQNNIYEIIDHGVDGNTAKYIVKYKDEQKLYKYKREKLMPEGHSNHTLALYEVQNGIELHHEYIVDKIMKEKWAFPTTEQVKTKIPLKCYVVRFLPDQSGTQWKDETWWARKLYPTFLREDFLKIEDEADTMSTDVYKLLQTHIQKKKLAFKLSRDFERPFHERSLSEQQVINQGPNDQIMLERSDEVIHVFYDQATTKHKWNPGEDGEVHQERPERIKWAHEGVTMSGVETEMHELKYNKAEHQKDAEEWIRNFQQAYNIGGEKFPQVEEMQKDAKKQMYSDGYTEDKNQTMESVFASMCILNAALEKWKDAKMNKLKKVNIFCIVRPPGHHAQTTNEIGRYTSGFCVFNNVVILTHHLLKTPETKVMQIDLDYHRGDGNDNHLRYARSLKRNDIMETNVVHIDVFAANDYPHAGRKEMHCECIDGKAPQKCKGSNSHFHAIGSEDFGRRRHKSLMQLTNQYMESFVDDNTVVIVQLGVDAHLHDAGQFIDPSTWMNMDRGTKPYTPAITRHYYDFACLLRAEQQKKNFSIFVVLEGGYDKLSLQCSIAAFLQGLNGMEMINDQKLCGPTDESHEAIEQYKRKHKRENSDAKEADQDNRPKRKREFPSYLKEFEVESPKSARR